MMTMKRGSVRSSDAILIILYHVIKPPIRCVHAQHMFVVECVEVMLLVIALSLHSVNLKFEI